MSLPAPWVDRIFQRLTLIFGRDFLARYDGQEIADVKADWAEELAGFQQSPEAIKHALGILPADKPPTVLQFKELCRKAPLYVPKALPAPPPDPSLAEELRRTFKPVSGQGDRAWADKLRQRIAAGYRPTMFQRDCMAEMFGSEAPQ
jgi:hypothetical protein